MAVRRLGGDAHARARDRARADRPARRRPRRRRARRAESGCRARARRCDGRSAGAPVDRRGTGDRLPVRPVPGAAGDGRAVASGSNDARWRPGSPSDSGCWPSSIHWPSSRRWPFRGWSRSTPAGSFDTGWQSWRRSCSSSCCLSLSPGPTRSGSCRTRPSAASRSSRSAAGWRSFPSGCSPRTRSTCRSGSARCRSPVPLPKPGLPCCRRSPWSASRSLAGSAGGTCAAGRSRRRPR